MMRNIPFVFLSFLAVTLCSSCSSGKADSPEDTVDSFSTAYFNWQFQKALHYSTAESQRWLSYNASQVTQQDIDSLKAMATGADYDIKDISSSSDTSAIATVKVNGFLAMDSIGKTPHITESATFRLPLVKRNGKWLVNLSYLPRPEH